MVALPSVGMWGNLRCLDVSTSKSATRDNSPTVPTSSSDAATRCATRKVASQCEDVVVVDVTVAS